MKEAVDFCERRALSPKAVRRIDQLRASLCI